MDDWRTTAESSVGWLTEARDAIWRALDKSALWQSLTARGTFFRFTAAEQRRGQRADAIAAKLRQKLPQMAQNRVQLIARTEVAKADTAVTQARAERLGLAWYDWTTSKDQRVRQAHAHLESVLVAWSDAPAPEQLVGERSKLGHYHAGGAPNCRCLALPLISLDEIKWPHKVYSHGHIELVSRTQFEKWIRIPEVA